MTQVYRTPLSTDKQKIKDIRLKAKASHAKTKEKVL